MGIYKLILATIAIAGGPALNHGIHTALLNCLEDVLFGWYVEKRIEFNSGRPFLTRLKEPFTIRDATQEWIKLESIMYGSFPLGCIVGSAFIWLFVKIGRKKCLLITNSLSLFSLILMALCEFSGSSGLLIISRMIVGMTVGVSSGVAPMYLIEIAPFCVRGIVGSAYYVMVAHFINISHIISTPLAVVKGASSYLIYSYIACLPVLFVYTVLLFICPESPKYLFFDQEDEGGAEEALAWLRDDEVAEEMDELREELAVLTETGPFTFTRLFTDQNFRSPLIISVVIMFGQQICGVECLIYFSHFLLNKIWKVEYEKAVYCVLGLSIFNFVVSFVSMCLAEKIGRKNLLMGSYLGMIFVSFMLTLLLIVGAHRKEINTIAVVFIFLYVISWAVGCGTIPWFYPAELTNHFARPITITIAVTLTWITQFCAVMLFRLILFQLESYFLTIALVINIVLVIFLFFTMRETSKLHPVEIIDLFYD